MRSARWWMAGRVGVAGLVILLCGVGRDVRAADPEPAEIVVTVKDAQTKAPLSGVKVELRSGRSSGDGYTGDDGIAKLQSDAAPGNYFQIRGTSEGLCPVSWTLNDRGGGAKPPAAIELLMEKAVGISGTVVDQDGKPLPGAKLLCTIEKKYADAHLHLSASWLSVTADSDGKFSVPNAPAEFDSANLAAYHRQCIGADAFLQPKPFPDVAGLKNGNAQLKLTRGVPLKLVVHAPDGSPVRNARVNFGGSRGSVNDYPEEKVDAQGTLTLGIAQGTETMLTITAKGRSPELLRPMIGAKEQTINVTLQPGHLLQGTVMNGDGDPAVTGQVSIETWRGTQTLHPRLKIDGEGHFSWPDAPADDLVVSVWTGSEQKSNITVKAGQENVIKMPPPSTFKGTVVDAATGAAVTDYKVMAGLSWEKGQAMNWRPADETGSEVAPDGGTFAVTMRQDYPWRAFRVVADGYLPSDSTAFKMEGKEVAFTFKLERGKPVTGKLVGTDGKPAAGVVVMLVPPGNPLQLTNGATNEWQTQSATNATTGADGSFTLPPQREGFLLLALSDAGVAQCSKADFEKKAEVTLKPWGKLEGMVKTGTKVDAGTEVTGWASQPYSDKQPMVQWNFNTATDAQGKFSFTRLPPMEISFGRRVDLGNNSSTQTAVVPVKVKEGETSTIQIGGVGRPVNGHVTIPPEIAAAGFNFFNSTVSPTKGGGGQQFLVKPDGSFHIDDLAEGTYTVDITVTDTSKPNEWMRGVPIGHVHGTFTVPPVPGGVSDESIDVGTMAITRTAAAGSKAPDFSAKTLDGTEWKLSAQQGKVVVLSFWSATYSPTTADQPKLAALWDAHGKDPHFALLALGLGDEDGTATKKAADAHNMHYPIAALGRARQSLVQEYPMQKIPTFWVIGVDGLVIGQNVTAEQLEPLVAQHLNDAK